LTYYADFHLHSKLSLDSKANMSDQIEKAIELGLEEICFTEHLDFDERERSLTKNLTLGPRSGFMDETDYERQIAEARQQYSHRIKIGYGVEAGQGNHAPQQAEALIHAHHYDFVLASIHLMHESGMVISVPWREGLSEAETYPVYFDDLVLLSGMDFFDVIAHCDIIKRFGIEKFGPFQAKKYEEQIRIAFANLIAKGKGIEINTSGLRQSCHETMPNLTLLQWYREMGGEILTLGSDAHAPGSLAYGLKQGYELAREAGFQYFTTFHQRQPHFHRL